MITAKLKFFILFAGCSFLSINGQNEEEKFAKVWNRNGENGIDREGKKSAQEIFSGQESGGDRDVGARWDPTSSVKNRMGQLVGVSGAPTSSVNNRIGQLVGVSGAPTSSVMNRIGAGYIGDRRGRIIGKTMFSIFTNGRLYYYGSRYFPYFTGARPEYRNCNFSITGVAYKPKYEDDGEKIHQIFFECEAKYECCELDCCYLQEGGLSSAWASMYVWGWYLLNVGGAILVATLVCFSGFAAVYKWNLIQKENRQKRFYEYSQIYRPSIGVPAAPKVETSKEIIGPKIEAHDGITELKEI